MDQTAQRKPGLIFGDSHIGAWKAGLEKSDGRFGAFETVAFWEPRYQPSMTWTGSELLYCDDLQHDLLTAAAKSPSIIVALLAGTRHFQYGAVTGPRPFDVVHPAMQDLPCAEGATLVPYDLLWRMFWQDHNVQFGFLSKLRSVYAGPIVVPCFPPLVQSSERILQFAPPQWADEMHEKGVPPATLRRKLWAISASALEAVCRSHGVMFVPVPQASLVDGYIHPDLLSDAFHGNASYGSLALEQLAALLTTPGEIAA